MKLIYLILFVSIFCKTYSQCKCESNPDLKDRISCDVTNFKNHAKLYWQYNCDSSWLVFESRNGKKKILISFDSAVIDLTERLGYIYTAEYKSTFLVLHNVISGCCDPAEFILFNKETGDEEQDLGRLIFYSENPKYPYVVYFGGNKPDNQDVDYNFLIVQNIDNNKIFRKALPKNRIIKTLEFSTELFAEYLFDDPFLKGNVLVLPYRFKTDSTEDSWSNAKISIVLK